MEKIVDWGFNVMHSDVDVVWFRDPLPYFLGAPCKDIDVAVSSGECGREGQDWGRNKDHGEEGIYWGRSSYRYIQITELFLK